MAHKNLIRFAIEAHQSVNHLYDGAPYSLHLISVSQACERHLPDYMHLQKETYLGMCDDLRAACWLHDTIEDCRLTYNDIKNVAGERVADIVFALTNNKGKTRKERADRSYYEGIRVTPGAQFVKLCDRIANVIYSRDSGSRMYGVYQSEKYDFYKGLFETDPVPREFMGLVSELDSLLGWPEKLVNNNDLAHAKL